MRHARDDYNRIQDPAGIIPDDEPVLLIRGQDKAATQTAFAWADENDRLGGDPRLSEAVRCQAEAIARWQVQHSAKIADVPADVPLLQSEGGAA